MVESDDKCQNCWWPLLELVMTIVKIDDENDDYSDKDDNDDCMNAENNRQQY